jgi:hypothetical protein
MLSSGRVQIKMSCVSYIAIEQMSSLPMHATASVSFRLSMTCLKTHIVGSGTSVINRELSRGSVMDLPQIPNVCHRGTIECQPHGGPFEAKVCQDCTDTDVIGAESLPISTERRHAAGNRAKRATRITLLTSLRVATEVYRPQYVYDSKRWVLPAAIPGNAASTPEVCRLSMCECTDLYRPKKCTLLGNTSSLTACQVRL